MLGLHKLAPLKNAPVAWLLAGPLLLGVGCSDSTTEQVEDPPMVDLVPPASNPAIPEDLNLKVTCTEGPETVQPAQACPIIRWNSYDYWAYSDGSNASSMTVVAYDASGAVAGTWERPGARYIWQITVDEATETVTLWGQASRTIELTWEELRI